MRAALRVREIALEHDARAAEALEAKAELPYETPIWDEVAAVMARSVKRPGLIERLLEAQADPAIVTPAGGAAHMGESIALQMEISSRTTR